MSVRDLATHCAGGLVKLFPQKQREQGMPGACSTYGLMCKMEWDAQSVRRCSSSCGADWSWPGVHLSCRECWQASPSSPCSG